MKKLKAELGGQGGGQWLNPQAAAPAGAPLTVAESSLLDQIVEEGASAGSDAAAKERGKDMVKKFVTEVLAGTITHGARHRGDDQRAHRADRSL